MGFTLAGRCEGEKMLNSDPRRRPRRGVNYRSCVHLFIVSHKLTPNEIGERLGIRCDEAVWKGAPNPSGKPKLHPFNLIVFHSRLSASKGMEQHAKDILSRICPVWSKVKRLPKSCSASLNFYCKMGENGGWSFDPSIMDALAKLDVPCVFTLDVTNKNQRK